MEAIKEGLKFKAKVTETDSMPRKRKKKVSLTIDEGLLDWIDAEIEKFTFQSRSNAVEQAIFKLKKKMEEKVG